jgi:hypothetical protein
MPARLSRTRDIARSTGQLAIAAVLLICAIAVAATVVMHLVDPLHYGLWWGPQAFFFGPADSSVEVRQAHDGTLYLAALVVVPLCVLVARELYGYARKSLARQTR